MRSRVLLLAAALTACAISPGGQVSERPASIEREGPRFVALDITAQYGCAVSEGGQLWCWGDDPALELGLRPSTAAWTEASRVELDFAVEQVVTAHATCVLGRDRAVRCWQTKGRAVEAMGPTIIEWAAGAAAIRAGLCARFDDGSFVCGNAEQVTERRPANTALDVHGWVWLDPHGGIHEFGYDIRFVLERQSVEKVRSVVQIGRVDHAEVLRGDCVLAAERIRCPLDRVAPPYRYLEIPGVESVRSFDITTGSRRHGCAVGEDGSVVCWGEGGEGQRGDGATTRVRPPTAVAGIVGARAIAVASGLSCVADREGLACWGTFEPREPAIEQAHVLDGAVSLVAERDFSCATLEVGEHRCWGRHSAWLSASDVIDLSVTTQIRPVDFAVGTVAELAGHCVLGVDGELDCKTLPSPYRDSHCPTGRREIGDHRRADPWCPALEQYGPGSALDVLGYADDICVISTAGFECLGRRSLLDRGQPALERPTKILARSHDLVCVIHAGGELGCWPTPRHSPSTLSVPIPEHRDFVALAGVANGPYACALRSVGEVWCWLETGTPAFALALAEIAAIEAIERYGPWDAERLWVVTRDGRAGSIRVDPSEQAIEWLELTDVVELDAGHRHVCLRQRDGAVSCIGQNSVGQLARMPPNSMGTPTRIRTVEHR